MRQWVLLVVFGCGLLGCSTGNGSKRTLISVSQNMRADDGVVLSGSGWSVSKRTLVGGVQDGVELIDVDNGTLQFSVIATRGMNLYKVTSGSVNLGWDSPVQQIPHPKHVDLQDHGGLGWLTGFNEALVRCGVAFAGHPGEDNERLLTLHGRIGNIPASEVEVSVDAEAPHRIRIKGLVEERMFKFGVFELWTEISTVPGSDRIQIVDLLVNRSAYEQEYQIIYHANYGSPLLQKGAQFSAAVRELSPFDEYAAKDLATYETYLGPTLDYGEQVYCLQLHGDANGMTTVMLHNAAGDRGVAMHYALDTLPVFTLWKNTDTLADGYVTGLEPGTGFPYNRSVERASGRVPKLAPGAEVRFQVELQLLADAGAVDATRAAIAKIQNGRKPVVNTSAPRAPAVAK